MASTEGGDESTRKLAIRDLQGPHHDILVRAIANVLSSPAATTAYGQIIDGVPLHSTVFDTHAGLLCPGHPLIDYHLELSADVITRVEQLRNSFDSDALEVNSELAFTYRAAAPGSRAFRTRLIELVAVAVHQIAVLLFKQGPIRPYDDPLLIWRPGKDLHLFYEEAFTYPPTLFRHEWYQNYSQYPEGIADAVGYWAEARILGGVVLFDRRMPGSSPDVEPNAIYFHSDNRNVTYRIYRLLPKQLQQLLDFLLSETTPPPYCPLPIHATEENRKRVDPEEPMKETGIYRDKWERRALSGDDFDSRLRDVVDTFNFLSREEYGKARVRAINLRDRLMLGEDLNW